MAAGRIRRVAIDPGHLHRFAVRDDVVRAPADDDRVVGNRRVELLARRHGLVVRPLPFDPGSRRKLAGTLSNLVEHIFGRLQRRHRHRKTEELAVSASFDVIMRIDEARKKGPAAQLDNQRGGPDELVYRCIGTGQFFLPRKVLAPRFEPLLP